MKLGIALGGGGAKGFAHIGVLKALAASEIHFDVVSGTSIGALVGAAYAAGRLEQLEKEVSSVKITDIPLLLSPAWSTKGGLFSGKSALDLLSEIVGIELIEDLPKKFAAVSVDLLTEKLVVHTKGNLRRAVRSSISIPAVFTPVTMDQNILVDGGLLEPVPVEICRELGADFVIAVDLFGSDRSEVLGDAARPAQRSLWPAGIQDAISYLRDVSAKMGIAELLPAGKRETNIVMNLIEVVEATLAISQRQLTAARLAQHPPDYLLQPPVADVGALDFHRGVPVIEIGRLVAQRELPKIKERLAERQ